MSLRSHHHFYFSEKKYTADKKRSIIPDAVSPLCVYVCVRDSIQGCAVPCSPVTTVCVPAEPSPPLLSQLLFLPCSYVSRSWRARDRGRVQSWDGESIPSGHTHTLVSTCKHVHAHTQTHTICICNIQSKTGSDTDTYWGNQQETVYTSAIILCMWACKSKVYVHIVFFSCSNFHLFSLLM